MVQLGMKRVGSRSVKYKHLKNTAFCLTSLVNGLPTMQGANNVYCTSLPRRQHSDTLGQLCVSNVCQESVCSKVVRSSGFW